MKRKIRRLFQWTLVVTLTTVLSASPVSAGWLLHRMHCHQQVTCCYVAPDPCVVQCAPACPPQPCCPPPVDCCGAPVVSTPVINDCPCGCGEVVGGSISIIQAAPMVQAPMVVEPMIEGTIIESAPVESFDSGTVIESLPADAIRSSSDEAVEAEPVPPADVPAPTPEPSVEAAPAEAAPAAEAPAEDPFAAPADEAPAAEPPSADEEMDDLFGDPPAPEEAPAEAAPDSEAPADEPPAEESSIDDLFGADTPTEEPADALIETPADAPAEAAPADSDDSIDDLFGEAPATDEPASDTPVTAPSDDLDDLFGAEAEAAAAELESPAAEPEAPAEEPESTSDEIDDLFGDSPSEDAPAADDQPSIDDLFGETPNDTEAAEESAPTTESNSIDDLFGETPGEIDAAEEHEPAVESTSIEDLFGAAPTIEADQVKIFSELPAPVATASPTVSVTAVATETVRVDPLSNTHVRTWIDNSGSFSTEGRLIAINRGNVRLLKTNGRTCTVPHDRLSEADAAYVDSIRKQQDDSPLVAMVTE